MVTVLKRNIFQRLFGKPATPLAGDQGAATLVEGNVVLALDRLPELTEKNGAVRLESEALPVRLLVFRDGDGNLRAYRNECAHAKRRLDPIPGEKHLQCCSMGHTTYDYQGQVVAGDVEGSVTPYPVREEGDQAIIEIPA